jgi:hypothetical protein
MLGLWGVGSAEPTKCKISERKGSDEETGRSKPARRFARKKEDVRNKELQKRGN